MFTRKVGNLVLRFCNLFVSQSRCDAENAYTRALQKTENSFEKLAGKAKG